MNRIIGSIVLIIGIIFQLTFASDETDFLTGFLIGGGILLLITGKFKSKKN